MTNYQDIKTFFETKTQLNYAKWFQVNLGGTEIFPKTKTINEKDFITFWNQANNIIFFKNQSFNLIEFLILNTIIINETGGVYKPISEGVNKLSNPESPGISYAFNRIEGLKQSYNTMTLNKTAFELFNDIDYINAHGQLPHANLLKNTKDLRWKATVFPTDVFPDNTVLDPAITTFVSEADFFKFRGRGLIQTTGRGNYIPLINFVFEYDGNNSTIKHYQKLWGDPPFNQDQEIIATRSTNKDWDTLFQKTDLIIAIKAIELHADGAGKYQFIPTTTVQEVETKIKNVAQKINNKKDYVDLQFKRVLKHIRLLKGTNFSTT